MEEEPLLNRAIIRIIQVYDLSKWEFPDSSPFADLLLDSFILETTKEI